MGKRYSQILMSIQSFLKVHSTHPECCDPKEICVVGRGLVKKGGHSQCEDDKPAYPSGLRYGERHWPLKVNCPMKEAIPWMIKTQPVNCLPGHKWNSGKHGAGVGV